MAKEKMVPLDVTGNPVEVTLKDEDIKEDVPVEESNIREIVEEETPQEVETKEVEETEEVEDAPQEEEADPYKTDDLQDYSKGVKKRINNLVGRM